MKDADEKIFEAYRSSVLESRTTKINEAYKVAQNPSDKLWYALGSVGKYWMPVSSGYKSKKEAEKFAEKQPKADKAARKLVGEDTDLNEASPVEFSEIPEDRQKLVMALVGKNDVDNHAYFDGIHGIIVHLKGKYGTDSYRVKKQDLKKIMSDKNVRWVDISAIGF
jgi:hypothetical protein